jgi:hypothetical protein
MKKVIFLFIILMVDFLAIAKPILIQDIPFCDATPIVFADIDGDGLKETICTKNSGVKKNNKYTQFRDFYVHDVVIRFDNSREFLFAVKTVTPSGTDMKAYDAYFDAVILNGYKHRLLKKKLGGVGLLKVYPEKSSVIYYWDKNTKSMQEFWESD